MTRRNLACVVAAVMAATVIAGCGSTVVPSDEPDASPSQIANVSPDPTRRSFEPLPSECPAPPIDSSLGIEAWYEALRTVASGDVRLISATAVDAGSSGIEYEPLTGGYDGGILKGGSAIPLTVTGTFNAALFEVDAIGASLQMADGRIFPLAIERDPLSIRVPDAIGSGSVDISLAWSDSCYEYEAGVRFDATVVLSPVVEACTSGDPMDTLIARYRDAEASIADQLVPIFIDTWHQRYDGGSQFGEGDVLGTFEESTPVAAASPGSALTYALADAEFRLSDVRAEFYSRDAALADTTGEPSFWAHRESVNGAPSMELVVPSHAGRYAVLAHLEWQLPCAFGSAFAVVGVDVE